MTPPRGTRGIEAASAGVTILEPTSSSRDGKPQSPILEIERLNRRFGANEVVKSLSVTVGCGERVALCGRNGSG